MIQAVRTGRCVLLGQRSRKLTSRAFVGPSASPPRDSTTTGPDGDTRLVSFLLQWPNSTQRPVRTAWIML